MKLSHLLIAAAGIITSGCASQFVDVRAGSEKVSVAEPSQVTSCESKGTVTSSVLAKLWLINRGAEGVEENLLQMAKNTALEERADTLVRGASSEFGKRTFSLYKCRP